MIITYKQKIGRHQIFYKGVGKSRNKLMENIITMTIPNVTLKKIKLEFRPKIGICFFYHESRILHKTV